jgi:serine/threonine protein kinase
VFRESTIRSLFDEILRGLRIVHQHKMLHLDIKPANIFITDDNKRRDDRLWRRARGAEQGGQLHPPHVHARLCRARDVPARLLDGPLDRHLRHRRLHLFACMQGYPPNDAPQRLEKDRLALRSRAARRVFGQPDRSGRVVHVARSAVAPAVGVCAAKGAQPRRRAPYTKLSVGEKVRLQFDNMVTDTKKNLKRATRFGKT